MSQQLRFLNSRNGMRILNIVSKDIYTNSRQRPSKMSGKSDLQGEVVAYELTSKYSDLSEKKRKKNSIS